MKKLSFLLSFLGILVSGIVNAQKLWTEQDRKYLLDSLTISRDQLLLETSNLSPAQWNFKESPDRWSIKEVVEHIAIWELLLSHEVSRGLSAGVQEELNKTSRPDSIRYAVIMEENPHVSTNYTKPFTYTLPMGLNDGKNNVEWFLKMRNESIAYIKTATEDLRSHYLKQGRPNTHQVLITIYGHTLRHVRQIKKIKANANYPMN